MNLIFQDRLMTPVTTLRMMKGLCELSLTLRRLQERAFIEVPIFLIVGEEDRLTPMKQAVDYFDKIKCVEKSIYVIGNGFHEPLFDTERDEVIQQMTDWIYKKLPTAPSFCELKSIS